MFKMRDDWRRANAEHRSPEKKKWRMKCEIWVEISTKEVYLYCICRAILYCCCNEEWVNCYNYLTSVRKPKHVPVPASGWKTAKRLFMRIFISGNCNSTCLSLWLHWLDYVLHCNSYSVQALLANSTKFYQPSSSSLSGETCQQIQLQHDISTSIYSPKRKSCCELKLTHSDERH